MLLSLQRRQQQEEAKARKEIEAMQRREREREKEEERAKKKEEQAARRQAILEAHKLKKAIEEAEREVSTTINYHLFKVFEEFDSLPLNLRRCRSGAPFAMEVLMQLAIFEVRINYSSSFL